MSRPLRIEFEGAWYHVMHRGARQQVIFKTNRQRDYFLSLLSVVSERFHAEIHAFCLMSTHYHLLLRTPAGNLQRIMRHINGVYTQYYNRAEQRDGALFRGRYKAVLIDAQAHWHHLSRYIHRNPVDADSVEVLADYRWSSYPAFIGLAARPKWLVTASILAAFGERNSARQYQRFVEGDADDRVYRFYAKKKISSIMGDEAFVAKQLREREALVDTPELRSLHPLPSVDAAFLCVARQFAVPKQALMVRRRGRASVSPARPMAMLVLHDICGLSLQQVAAEFGLRSYSSVSSVIRRLRLTLADDAALLANFNAIKRDLTS
ncbi:MAG: transposase [Cellvibrionaceae bacterium]|nr:transposase [Cellvibrionaceae bacterium]